MLAVPPAVYWGLLFIYLLAAASSWWAVERNRKIILRMADRHAIEVTALRAANNAQLAVLRKLFPDTEWPPPMCVCTAEQRRTRTVMAGEVSGCGAADHPYFSPDLSC